MSRPKTVIKENVNISDTNYSRSYHNRYEYGNGYSTSQYPRAPAYSSAYETNVPTSVPKSRDEGQQGHSTQYAHSSAVEIEEPKVQTFLQMQQLDDFPIPQNILRIESEENPTPELLIDMK